MKCCTGVPVAMSKSETITEEKFESVKRYLEKGGRTEDDQKGGGASMPHLSFRFCENFITQAVHVDLIDYGRLICSIKVHPGLLNDGNFLHGGAMAMLVDLVGTAVLYTIAACTGRVSVEINVSYLDVAYTEKEIEIEAKVLGIAKVIGIASVKFRKKNTGKIIAHGRHTMYLAACSKL